MSGWTRSRRAQIALGLGVPVLLAALALASRIPDALPSTSRAAPTPVLLASLPAPAPASVAALPAPAPTREPAGVKVYVSGAVARPGVYALRSTDRVEDALAAAGGADENADLTRLNLAQRVRDEQQINVPLRADPAAGPVPAGAADDGPVDLNTATLQQLDALPGIGPTTARRILDFRTQHGPFARPDDLKTHKLVSASAYERIKDRLVAR